MLFVLQQAMPVPMPTDNTDPWKYLTGVLAIGMILVLGAILKAWADERSGKTKTGTGTAIPEGVLLRLDRLEEDVRNVKVAAHNYRDAAHAALGNTTGAKELLDQVCDMFTDKIEDHRQRIQGLEDRERQRMMR